MMEKVNGKVNEPLLIQTKQAKNVNKNEVTGMSNNEQKDTNQSTEVKKLLRLNEAGMTTGSRKQQTTFADQNMG